jgi:hypothetical protein
MKTAGIFNCFIDDSSKLFSAFYRRGMTSFACVHYPDRRAAAARGVH